MSNSFGFIFHTNHTVSKQKNQFKILKTGCKSKKVNVSRNNYLRFRSCDISNECNDSRKSNKPVIVIFLESKLRYPNR